jgi:hypothetical protein
MISTKLFSEKMIFSKIFFGVWFTRKNYEMQKSEFGKCRRNLSDQRPDQVISGWISAILARSSHIRPDPGRFGQIRLDQ